MPIVVSDREERLLASYSNSYIDNQKVLVPIFERKNDEKGLSILKEMFPSRRVVGLQCVDLF